MTVFVVPQQRLMPSAVVPRIRSCEKVSPVSPTGVPQTSRKAAHFLCSTQIRSNLDPAAGVPVMAFSASETSLRALVSPKMAKSCCLAVSSVTPSAAGLSAVKEWFPAGAAMASGTCSKSTSSTRTLVPAT